MMDSESSNSGDRMTSAEADLRQAEAALYASNVSAVEQGERPFGVVVLVIVIWLGVALNAFLALNAWISLRRLAYSLVFSRVLKISGNVLLKTISPYGVTFRASVP